LEKMEGLGGGEAQGVSAPTPPKKILPAFQKDVNKGLDTLLSGFADYMQI
jgi:hypothetical protein